jgi:hypothetical protein
MVLQMGEYVSRDRHDVVRPPRRPDREVALLVEHDATSTGRR